MNKNVTPTPWRAEQYESFAGQYLIVSSEQIAPVAYVAENKTKGNAADNAAHIVKCVNAHDELVAALNKYEAAFEGMFTQCLSNPIRDAWGNQINTSLLNEAHSSALGALNAANGHQRTPQQEQELEIMRSMGEL